jgi:cell division septation protein DedD
MKAAGYKAYLVEAEVEGKGTWFRVRYGNYDSYESALEAKDEFERKVQKIAYVTRL